MMAINPLRPDQQAKVIATLEEATALSQELGPNAALAKAAKANGLPVELLQYTVNAYNTGQSLVPIKSGSTREERAESVPLASLEGVMQGIYPEPVAKKASVSGDYKLKPELLLSAPKPVKKSASLAPAPTAELSDEKVLPYLLDACNQLKAARSEVQTKLALYKRAQRDIQDYLENIRHMRLSDIVDQSQTAFGDLAKVVLEPLSDPYVTHKISRASHIVRISQQPFPMVKAAIDRLEALYDAGIECGKKEEAFLSDLNSADASECPSVQKYAQVIRRDLFPTPKQRPVEPVNKSAFDMGHYLLSQPAKALETMKTTPRAAAPTNPAAAVKPGANQSSKPIATAGSMYAPAQLEEINALTKSVALNGLLKSDPDLQGYDQNHLAKAFNEIQGAFPSVASSPVTLRPFLQRHLAAGGLDEFSLKNLAEQERILSQSKAPVR
jgi:hypothetical protein